MERILTTHVGSLLRPESLQADLVALERRSGAFDRDRFHANLRLEVTEVLADQLATGLDLVNDGEYGKSSWIRYIFNRLRGVELRYEQFDAKEILRSVPASMTALVEEMNQAGAAMPNAGAFDVYNEISKLVPFYAKNYSVSGEAMCWYCVGPISYDSTEIDEHISILKEVTRGLPESRMFVNALSPASIYYFVNEHYETEEDLVFAIARALGEEYRKIVDAGFQLHIDDAVMWHQYSAIRMAGGTKGDYERWAGLRVDALNYALEGIPQSNIRYHICSGSAHGPKIFDPSLREILPTIMRVRWGMLLFEQANVGHEHEWEVWKDVDLPDDRILIPGVVTHHTEMVEHPELVAFRLNRMTDLVGRERVIAGTDCGFAQSTYIGRVDQWTQWAKLRSLVEGAQLASH